MYLVSVGLSTVISEWGRVTADVPYHPTHYTERGEEIQRSSVAAKSGPELAYYRFHH